MSNEENLNRVRDRCSYSFATIGMDMRERKCIWIVLIGHDFFLGICMLYSLAWGRMTICLGKETHMPEGVDEEVNEEGMRGPVLYFVCMKCSLVRLEFYAEFDLLDTLIDEKVTIKDLFGLLGPLQGLGSRS
ncbi:hypothetical protein VNO77_44848 [Canavalia gladiata]|uniref:Uncharacterized protein n=1 Tax=Canavalia gladiata TaxID=3824 RepID=A0AAN9PRE8_CANGL